MNDVDLVLFDQASGRAALHELRDQVDQPLAGEAPDVGWQGLAEIPANLLKQDIRNVVNAGSKPAQQLIELGL